MSAAETVTLVTRELESQSLNAVVAGFSFAAALSWMDLVRWIVNRFVKLNKNSGVKYGLTAIFTTLLSVIIYIVMSRLSSRVRKPDQTLYSVTR